MMRFAGWFLVVMFVLIATGVRAQEEQREMRLTLQECVDYALANNATVLQDKYSVAIAETQVDGARNAFLPNVSATWSISRDVSGPREGQILDPTTGVLIQTLGEDRVSGGQRVNIGSLSVPLYDGGLIATLAARNKSLKQTEMNQLGNRKDVAFLVKQRYFQLLQAKRLLEVQQERVRVSEESLRRAETLYEIGSAAILEVSNARSSLATIRATLIQRENDVRIAQSNLAFAMGLGTEVDIVPAEEEFEIQPTGYSYAEALRIALEQHPDILASKYGMLASQDDYRATKYDLYHPTVRFTGGAFGWTLGSNEDFGGLEDLFLKNYSYGVGISVSMPLFNMNTSNALKRQKLTYLRSQEQLDQTKRQKALNIRQVYLNLERYQQLTDANKIAVQAAEENFKLEEERYNFGGGTFLERLTAQRDLFDARNSLVQAQYNYLITMAQLENELGVSPTGNSEE